MCRRSSTSSWPRAAWPVADPAELSQPRRPFRLRDHGCPRARNHRDLRDPPPAAVLDRLPDGRQRQRGGGHRPGGVPAPPPGPTRGRYGGAGAEGVAVGGDDPPGHRPPALGARVPRDVRRPVAARAPHDRRRPGPERARRARRLAVDGVPHGPRAPVAGERAVYLLREVFGYGYDEIARV